MQIFIDFAPFCAKIFTERMWFEMQKSTLIFGDSYSTFYGLIPEGYAYYYGGDRRENDVSKLEETWWHQLSKEADLNLVQNNSWSGSTIGYTGYNGDCSKDSSFICRLHKLENEGFFSNNRIDTVFVFGGTNDSWSNAPLGEIKLDNFKREELFSVLPAICFFLKELRRILQNAEIYCLVNTDIKPEIMNCLNLASKEFGVTPVNFDFIDKQKGHPSIKGMCQIKDGVLKAMQK